MLGPYASSNSISRPTLGIHVSLLAFLLRYILCEDPTRDKSTIILELGAIAKDGGSSHFLMEMVLLVLQVLSLKTAVMNTGISRRKPTIILLILFLTQLHRRQLEGILFVHFL
jgi:hypothetical protein